MFVCFCMPSYIGGLGNMCFGHMMSLFLVDKTLLCMLLQNCRSLISRPVCTIHLLTMRQENWRRNKSSKDGGIVHLLPPSLKFLHYLGPSPSWSLTPSSLTFLPPSYSFLPHTPSSLRRDVNHIHQLLMYARKIFYNIDVAHAVNEEAANL